MKQFILLFISLVIALNIQAQSPREQIVQHIQTFDQCQSVAITKSNGNALIYGQNEWIAYECPHLFTEAL